MKISIIMPVYNEEATIREIVSRVQATPFEKEILIVDDGSTDATPRLLDTLRAPGVTIIRHPRNRGKGAAVRTALEQVTGDVVLIQDADLEYDPSDYPKLIEPIVRGEADVVYGSRVKGKSRRGYLRYYLGGRAMSFLANVLYGVRLTDLPTGYKAFRTGVLKGIGIESDGFEFCAEITAKLARGGRRILEVPISYRPRSFRDGKKITWRSGFAFPRTLVRYRLP